MTSNNNQLIKLSIEQLLSADAHIGHNKQQRHPENISNIFATYNNKDLINIEKTLNNLEPVINIIIDAVANYETILIVAQHPSAKQINLSQPVLTTKWVHGALSNFKTIKQSKKVNFFQTLNRLPNALVLIHTTNDNIIINEAKLLEIPIIALRDSTDNPTKVLYPVPSNNTSDTVIRLFLKLVSQASYYGYAKNVLSFKQND